MPDSPFTHRDIEALNQSIRGLNETIKELRQEMASTYVRKDVLEPQLKEIKDDVARHGSYWDWLVRLIVAAVIIGLLGLLFAQGGGIS